jgi:hypothetical protein
MLREFIDYMDSIDTMERKATPEQIILRTLIWIKALIPTIDGLYNSAYFYALNKKNGLDL